LTESSTVGQVPVVDAHFLNSISERLHKLLSFCVNACRLTIYI
jgi:hypothetical protein